jgi:hypothetical protein
MRFHEARAMVMADLAVVEIAQGIAHGAGGVCREVALCRIVESGRSGECLLGGQLDFNMRQAGDVGELACDFGSEGKEFIHPFFHDAETLSGYAHARQARAVGYQKMKRGKAVSRKEAGGALVWEEEEGWARHPRSLNTVEAGNRQLGGWTLLSAGPMEGESGELRAWFFHVSLAARQECRGSLFHWESGGNAEVKTHEARAMVMAGWMRTARC